MVGGGAGMVGWSRSSRRGCRLEVPKCYKKIVMKSFVDSTPY